MCLSDESPVEKSFRKLCPEDLCRFGDMTFAHYYLIADESFEKWAPFFLMSKWLVDDYGYEGPRLLLGQAKYECRVWLHTQYERRMGAHGGIALPSSRSQRHENHRQLRMVKCTVLPEVLPRRRGA